MILYKSCSSELQTYFCLLYESSINSTELVIKSTRNSWTLNCLTSPNLKFCYKKHLTYIKWLWVDFRLVNWLGLNALNVSNLFPLSHQANFDCAQAWNSIIKASSHSIYIRTVSTCCLLCWIGFYWFMGCLGWAKVTVHSIYDETSQERIKN